MLNIVCGGSWLLKAILGAAGIHGENEVLKMGVVTLERAEGQCLTVDVLSMNPSLLNELRDCLGGVQIIASTPLTFNIEMIDERAALICPEK
jgi:predicted membrane chloride channel (bestrophin family)